MIKTLTQVNEGQSYLKYIYVFHLAEEAKRESISLIILEVFSSVSFMFLLTSSAKNISSGFFCFSGLTDEFLFTRETVHGILLFSSKTISVFVKEQKTCFSTLASGIDYVSIAEFKKCTTLKFKDIRRLFQDIVTSIQIQQSEGTKICRTVFLKLVDCGPPA